MLRLARTFRRGFATESDEAIARRAAMLPIQEVAAKLGLQDVLPYGRFKGKIDVDAAGTGGQGNVVLVTAITPTKAGEGKTTTSIGLHDALCRIGKKSLVVLREPSLGPLFGMKGGAAGGGHAQVVPMEDINLHFTGDFHAIGAAHNLLSALVDNHVYWRHEPRLDVRRLLWRRVIDMNDRALRKVCVGLGGASNGFPREDGYDIVAASEVMAVFCLASSLQDLERRLGNLAVGETSSRALVRAKDLQAAGAMTALLRDAFMPNLVQTLENNPALVHGGPFANIAHGCNSVVATRAARGLADYVVTEAGFGADLGAEKFLHIKCQAGGNAAPKACVLVATVRALKLHGGAAQKDLATPDAAAVERGGGNLARHLENVAKFGIPAVVAVNRFPTDSPEELAAVERLCQRYAAPCVVCDHHAQGGAGAEGLAQAVVNVVESGKAKFTPLYAPEASIAEKLQAVATKMYGASGVQFADAAKAQLAQLDAQSSRYPVCIAKTQYSFSDDPKGGGLPHEHALTIRELRTCHGAEFVVALSGGIMTMPGLPKVPAAANIRVEDGQIHGLF